MAVDCLPAVRKDSAATAAAQSMQQSVWRDGGVAMPAPEGRVGRDVQVRLQYLSDDPIYKTQKPMQITPNFLDTEGRTNVRLAPGELETIHDVRGHEDAFSLDDSGFRYVHAPTSFTQWSSQPEIGREYLPELETVLRREVDGCDEIMFYDARIRQDGDEGSRLEGLSFNPFARQVHTDNTAKSVIAKIQNLTEMKADYLMSGRARIINIWRPIKHPVFDCGLAIADGGSLQNGDVIECDRHRADTGEYWDTMGVIKYRQGFKWWYMSQQAPEEVLLFKNYDSATDVPARCCLHTAFDLPLDAIPPGAPARQSIEVRALIFTYPANARPPAGLKMPHPLAENLAKGNLRHMVLEHSITDRLRTDIDEGSEIKDAVLLLRRQEIKRLEGVQEALQSERDEMEKQLRGTQLELQQVRQELHIERQQRVEQGRLNLAPSGLYPVATPMSPGRQSDSGTSQSSGDTSDSDGRSSIHGPCERDVLLQQLERAWSEVQKWKAEAQGKGSQAVSTTWQASVDEQVRREREKDAFVIQNLHAEIRQLKSNLTARG